MNRCLATLYFIVMLGAAGMPATANADCQDRPPWLAGEPCLPAQPLPLPIPVPSLTPVTPLPDPGPSAIPACAPGTAPVRHPDGTIRCE